MRGVYAAFPGTTNQNQSSPLVGLTQCAHLPTAEQSNVIVAPSMLPCSFALSVTLSVAGSNA